MQKMQMAKGSRKASVRPAHLSIDRITSGQKGFALNVLYHFREQNTK